jgi:hypothetical protein
VDVPFTSALPTGAHNAPAIIATNGANVTGGPVLVANMTANAVEDSVLAATDISTPGVRERGSGEQPRNVVHDHVHQRRAARHARHWAVTIGVTGADAADYEIAAGGCQALTVVGSPGIAGGVERAS